MVIDEGLIKYLEDLSFITLSDEERGRICADLQNILAGMELLAQLDTSGVLEEGLPASFLTALRKDEVMASFPRDEILKNAPQANGKSFLVPKTVE